MSSSFTFTGSGLLLVSVTVVNSTTLKVKYSTDPKQSNPAGANDALNPVQYTLAGPSVTGVSSCATVSGDTESIQLNLSTAMAAGTWTLTVSNAVQTPGGTPLSAPYSIVFNVSATASVPALGMGAVSDAAEDIIRKHLSPAMAGPNWDALIAALGESDQSNFDNARKAFDQLFISSASDKYLEYRAADVGINKPTNVGINDDLFRSLVINSTTNKVTHEAIREILEVYYGRDSLRAFAETELDGPYALAAGLTLEWTLDEKTSFEFSFVANDFSNINSATAQEVAATLTKWMDDLGSDGFAIAVTNQLTGQERVRIYSGKLGLGSSVRITGGTAQDRLRFPNYIEVYSGTVSSGSGYSWVYTQTDLADADLTPDVTRLTLTTAHTPFPLIDLSLVQEGDYVIISADSQFTPTGVYTVKKVKIEYSGANIIQRLYLDSDLDISGSPSYLQLSNSAYRFFRPTKQTTSVEDNRTVVVSQGEGGVVDISIPATTQVVSRQPTKAAYGNINADIDILRVARKGNGSVTVKTASNHGLTAGDWITFNNIKPAQYAPWFTPGGALQTDASLVSWVTPLDAHSGVGLSAGTATTIQDGSQAGKVYCVGGFNIAGGAYVNESDVTRKFTITATSTITDATEADGATRYGYSWTGLTAAPYTMSHHTATEYDYGTPGKLLVTGGYDRATPTFLTSAARLDTSTDTWTNMAGFFSVGRAGHIAISDTTNKRIFFVGGATAASTATSDLLKASYLTSEPAIASPTPASMSLPRVDHQAIRLSDGRILVMGGRTLGRGALLDNATVVLWRFDTLDDSAGTYGTPLSMAGSVVTTPGKIGLSRVFSPGNYLFHTTLSATERSTLLNECTVEFWAKSDFAGPYCFYAFNNNLESSANNTLMEVGIDGTGKLYWRWEYGSGTDVVGTMTNAFTTYGFANRFNHIAIRKRFSGSWAVDVFINGVLRQTFTGLTNADGGTNSYAWFGHNFETSVNYTGELDDFRLSDIARTDLDIMDTYFRGVGEFNNKFDNYFAGEALADCEIYNPNTDTWTATGKMGLARYGHNATLLSDGRVLVVGGLGYNPSQKKLGSWTPSLAYADMVYPSTGLKEAEIWDPTTGMWNRCGSSNNAWHYATSQTLDSGKVLITGGEGFSSAPQVELFNVSKSKFEISPTSLSAVRYPAVSAKLSNGSVLILGGDDGTTTHTQQDLYVPASDKISSGGLNNKEFQVVTTPDTTTFTCASNVDEFMSTTGPERSVKSIDISTASRTSNVTTLVFTLVGISGHSIEVGDTIYVNSTHVSFGSGLKTVTSVTATTVSYNEIAANQASVAVVGSVSTDYSPDTTGNESTASSAPVGDPGPYVYDLETGLSVTGTSTTTLQAINAGSGYSKIKVDNAEAFPDADGYVVFDFGDRTQSAAIKYFGRYEDPTSPGDWYLKTDYSAVFNYSLPTGTSVTLLASSGSFAPEHPEQVGSFYVTDSSAGRVAAQTSTEDSLAAGIVQNITVVYPGDRGLGAEGKPTKDAQKLSTIVEVFGGNSLDNELPILRGDE